MDKPMDGMSRVDGGVDSAAAEEAASTRPVATGVLARALRERGFWLLILLVLGTFFTRLDALTVRREEPRRARIAMEMMESGDWVVPRQQGVLHLSRPPLQNWIFAAGAHLRGQMDAVAIRLPSALAVLATVVLIYLYGRRFLGPLGAATAGAAYATMGQVLELGTKGETECLFALFVTGSLLSWHAAAAAGPLRARDWSLAYFFVALGVLTKGPQPPVYFAGAAGLYLLLRRRWRELFTPAHLVGLAVGAGVVGLWLVPFWSQLGFDGVRQIFVQDVAMRFSDRGLGAVIQNLVSYPLEVLGSTLPWSILLVAYAWPRFRYALGPFRDAAIFLGLAIAVSFPTCWFPPGSHARYYLPLYPCLAVLVGAVVQRAATVGDAPARPLWRGLLASGCVLVLLVTLALAALKLTGPAGGPWDQAPAFVIAFTLLGLGAAAGLMRLRRQGGVRPAGQAVAILSAFAGLAYTGVLTNHWVLRANDSAAQIAGVHGSIPEDAQLYSLGYIDPIFAHYWALQGRPSIVRVDWSPATTELPAEVEYFCYSPGFAGGGGREALRFDWQPVGELACDFNYHEVPLRPLFVGRIPDDRLR